MKALCSKQKKEGMALKKILLCLFHERKHKLTLLTAVLLTTKTQNPPLPIKKRGRTAIKAFSRLGRVLIYFEQQPIKHAEILIMIFSIVHKKKAILKLSQKLPFFYSFLRIADYCVYQKRNAKMYEFFLHSSVATGY